MKLVVTQEKREETIDKIFALVDHQFEGEEVTVIFTKVLLQDAIRKIDEIVYKTQIKVINEVTKNI